MNPLRNGRVSSRLAGGMALTAIGLFALLFLIASLAVNGLGPVRLPAVALATFGGLTLLAVGFTLMVLGSNPFEDESLADAVPKEEESDN